MAGGTEESLVPTLVFSTLDDPLFDAGAAQTYLWAGVPLVGTMIDIQKYPIVIKDD